MLFLGLYKNIYKFSLYVFSQILYQSYTSRIRKHNKLALITRILVTLQLLIDSLSQRVLRMFFLARQEFDRIKFLRYLILCLVCILIGNEAKCRSHDSQDIEEVNLGWNKSKHTKIDFPPFEYQKIPTLTNFPDSASSFEGDEKKADGNILSTERYSALSARILELDPQYEFFHRNLMKFTEDYIVGDKIIEEIRSRRYLRRTLQTLAIIFGITAGLPFSNAACEAGYRLPFLSDTSVMCSTFAAGTIMAYGCVSTWVGLKLVAKLAPTTLEEDRIKAHSSLLKHRILRHLAANIAGIMSCIPDIYAVYKYNSNKFLVIPAFIVDYFFKTEGYYEFIDGFSRLRHKQERDDIQNDKLINLFDKLFLPRLYMRIQTGEIRIKDVKEKTANFIKKIVTFPHYIDKITSENGMIYSKKAKLLRRFFQGLNLVCPTGNEFVRQLLAYSAVNLYLDSPYASIPISLLVTLPSFSLDIIASTQTAGAVFDKAYNKYYEQSNKDFVEIFFPKLNKVIPFVATTLAILSSTGDAYVAHDTLKDSVFSSLKYVLPPMVVISNSIFEGYASTKLFKDVIMESCKLMGGVKKVAVTMAHRIHSIQSMFLSIVIPQVNMDFSDDIFEFL